MDLKENWEKKALYIVGIIFLIIIVYAYFIPFTGTVNNNTSTDIVTNSPVIPVQYPIPSSSNSSNNITNMNNSASIINIIKTAYPDYNIGTPTYYNIININGTNYNSVWAVPISKPNNSSTIYVDITGRIVLRI